MSEQRLDMSGLGCCTTWLPVPVDVLRRPLGRPGMAAGLHLSRLADTQTSSPGE